MNETIANINKTKSSFFEKINKIDKPLARLIKKKTEKIQINRIRNEREGTTDPAEVQRIMRDFYKQLYANKMDNLEEMVKFLEMHNLPPPQPRPFLAIFFFIFCSLLLFALFFCHM